MHYERLILAEQRQRQNELWGHDTKLFLACS